MLLRRDLISSLPALLSLPSLAQAAFDCEHIVADQQVFNLKSLGGPHVVHWIKDDTPPSITNLTFTLDICQTLKKHKGPSEDDCPSGTRGMALYNP